MSRRRRLLLALLVVALVGSGPMRRWLLQELTFHPTRKVERTPEAVGLAFQDVAPLTSDGLHLHGWWVPAKGPGPSLGSILYCHGNAFNVGTRVEKARLLALAGFDVLLFDYRGYGRSEGSPSEEGTYLDARAARAALLALPGVDPARILYLGESLGGAVATELAVAAAPRGLVLQSTFTSLRDMGRVHYPFIPSFVTPDAYPTLRRMAELRCPLLVLHGDKDSVVPLEQGRRLFDAAPEPKRFELFAGAEHNDLVALSPQRYADVLAQWARSLP